MSHAPTPEQQNAIDLYLTGRSLVIQAGAGTGKTSTLVFLADAAPSRRCQFVAFNRSIVEDARKKFPRNVTCSTAHSLAYRSICNPDFEDRQRNGKRMRSVDIANRLRVEALTVDNDGERKMLSSTFLAGLALRAVTRFCQSADETPGYRHVPRTKTLSDDANRAIARHLEPVVRRAWSDLSTPEGGLPFTTSTAMAVYLKLWQLSRPIIGADVILYDESQDASPVMVDVVARQADPAFRAGHRMKPAQLVFCGDSQQAIYAFTGAVDALETVPHDEEAFLTMSFRFGPAVAAVANHVLGLIPSARLRLTGCDKPSIVAAVAEPDAILTRTNATAVRCVFDTIAAGRRPHLVGGGADVIYFAEAARDLQAGVRTDHPELACFEDWQEVQDYVANDEQGGDLKLLVDLIDEFGATEIIDALKNQPKEDDADLVVSTAHKSKGREWDAVQIADDFPEDRLAAGGDEAVDELRLLYVAVTRAKLELDITALAFLRDGVPPSPVPAPVAPRAPRPERAPVQRSEHVGTVGSTITVEAGCVSAKGMTTRFGFTYLTQFATADGNVLKAFLDDELEPGTIYTLTARVKAHGDFRGVPETTINYVDHEELSGAVAAPEAPVGVRVEA